MGFEDDIFVEDRGQADYFHRRKQEKRIIDHALAS